MRRRLWVTGATLLIVAAGAATWAVRSLPRREAGNPAGLSQPPAATATVTRTDLSTSVSVPGDLGFGPARQIKGGPGTVTWLPRVGAVITRGQPLYRRDDRPVPLLYGRTPLFRSLATPGLIGGDVRVLADNLRKLGYRIGDQPRAGRYVDVPAPSGALSENTEPAARQGQAEPDSSAPVPQNPVTIRVRVRQGDAVLTPSLIAAIRRWQNANDMIATGTVEPADVVVQPGRLRVGSSTAHVGDLSDGPLMSVTGLAKVITVSLDASTSGAIHTGDAVTATMPDGGTAPAKVSTISTEAQPGDDESAEPKITVTIRLDQPKAADRLDAAPVQVDILGEKHDHVLAVPVGALLAALEGGHAVQIAGGPLVPVETGLFADGQVEITGPGIDEGVAVVTTS